MVMGWEDREISPSAVRHSLFVKSDCQVQVGLQNLKVVSNLMSFYRNTISAVIHDILQLTAVLCSP